MSYVFELECRTASVSAIDCRECISCLLWHGRKLIFAFALSLNAYAAIFFKPDDLSGGMVTKRYDAILDAALAAFAKNGFDGTGLREIAKTAGVAAATINYHFETKEKLFQEVVRLGAERSVRVRLERLEYLFSTDKSVVLEDIVRALFHVYNLPAEETSLADYEFNQLVVRFGFPDNEFARNVVHTPFNDMASHFINAMMKTPDGFSRQTAARAYLWSLPAGMTAISQQVRYALLAEMDPADPENGHSFDTLIDFICVGMRALAKSRPSKGRKKKASRTPKA